MTRFFDASAVVGAYVRQGRTAGLRRLLASGNVAVSRLSEVEVVSAFARLAHEEALTVEERNGATAAFLTDLDGWAVLEMTPEVTARARTLLLQHPLRAGDALQLASALVLQARLSRPLGGFVAADHRLLGAARREQLTVTEV